MGRRSKQVGYDPDIAERLCDIIETGTRGIARICQETPGMPHPVTIYRWLAANPKFRERYDKAKDNQLRAMEDELLAITEATENDMIPTKKGGLKVNRECVERAKLRAQMLQWVLARLTPKRFGDRMALGSGGGMGPIEIVVRTVGEPSSAERK